MNISEGLANPTTLVGLALSMRKLDSSHIYARTTPVIPDPYDPNRVVWSDEANNIWDLMRENKPLSLNHKTNDTNKKNANYSSKNTNNQDNENTDNDNNINENDKLNKTTDPKKMGRVDPKTGLIKNSQGQLIDPNTGGIVNPENGTIHNPQTGQYVGFADKYANNVLCAVPRKK